MQIQYAILLEKRKNMTFVSKSTTNSVPANTACDDQTRLYGLYYQNIKWRRTITWHLF